jgi:hypothetical protein
MSMFLLYAKSLLYVHVHAACPTFMSMLQADVHSACPCQCCIFNSMPYVHVRAVSMSMSMLYISTSEMHVLVHGTGRKG